MGGAMGGCCARRRQQLWQSASAALRQNGVVRHAMLARVPGEGQL